MSGRERERGGEGLLFLCLWIVQELISFRHPHVLSPKLQVCMTHEQSHL